MPDVIETADFDVVIVAFNDAKTLPACLAAVNGLNPKPSRLIVVDNASSDDSARIARQGGAEVLALKENTGFAGGMNHGIKASNAPWVFLLNPDWVADVRKGKELPLYTSAEADVAYTDTPLL